jgi:RNase P subunit RPR2
MKTISIEKELFNLPAGYKKMMRRARESERYYSISPAFYEALISEGCFYCKTDLTNPNNMNIDRVDNNGHYTPDNVVPCCKHCNFAKRFMGIREFMEWASKVTENKAIVLERAEKLSENVDDPWIGDEY